MMLAKLFLAAMILLVVTKGTFSTENSHLTESDHVFIADKITGLEDKITGLEDKITGLEDKITGLEGKMQFMMNLIARLMPASLLNDDEDRAKACGVIATIPNSRITASSIYANHPNCGPQHSRLFSTSGAGSWRPQPPYEGEWIQADLGRDYMIVGVATQGGRWSRWVTTFTVSVKPSSSSSFQNIEDQSGDKIFKGNTVENTVVVNNFGRKVEASIVRIYPVTWKTLPYVRFDILTC